MNKEYSTNSKCFGTVAIWVPIKEDRASHLKHKQQNKK